MPDMRNTDFDREIAVFARRQHGVFHTRQARTVGGSAAILRNRAANGAILQMAPKVWAVAGHPATWRRQYKAAELSVTGGTLADQSAGLVHGLEGSRIVRPKLVITSEVNRRSPLADVRRASDVDVTTVEGIRVTTVAQTLFDLLRCCEITTVERALDGALIGGSVTVAELVDLGERVGRLRPRHLVTWRALMEERSDQAVAVADSVLELALHRALRPLSQKVHLEYQWTPPWWKARRRRVDAYIPEWRLIIEADGRRWHTRVADFERDRSRDNTAAAHGHRVLRFTHACLTERSTDVVALVSEAGACTEATLRRAV